jgi:ankyrin repeat protein
MNKKNFSCACLAGLMLLCSNAVFAQRGMDQINVNGQFVMAARAGQIARVAALLEEGAKVNSRDRNGDSPLNMAAAKGNVELVDVLLKAGADVNLANLAGVTPLMGAAFSGKVEIVRKLLAAGARIEPLDRVKKNAATYAAGSGCADCLGELLRAGTPVNGRLENELTLLMWAAAYGHEAAVNLLLAQGAERGLKDNRGKTAADMAREGNHLNVARLLDQP